MKGDPGATGAQGAPGVRGDPGPIGPSHGYSTSFATTVHLTVPATSHDLMTLTVPAGSYVVTARFQGITIAEAAPPGNSYRYDCSLSHSGAGTVDSIIARVGTVAGVESYLTFTGAVTATDPGQLKLTCLNSNNHPLDINSGSMTAVLDGGLN